MNNQNNISNPKTIRRYERARVLWEQRIEFANKNGYKTECRSSTTWSFSKDGVPSVLGFDSESEVLDFIFEHKPDPKKIFPPYNS